MFKPLNMLWILSLADYVTVMVQKLRRFCWIGGFCPLVELHREGSDPAACATGLLLSIFTHYYIDFLFSLPLVLPPNPPEVWCLPLLINSAAGVRSRGRSCERLDLVRNGGNLRSGMEEIRNRPTKSLLTGKFEGEKCWILLINLVYINAILI